MIHFDSQITPRFILLKQSCDFGRQIKQKLLSNADKKLKYIVSITMTTIDLNPNLSPTAYLGFK